MRVRADHPVPAVPLRRGDVEYPGSVTGDASLGTSAGPAGRVGTSLPELVEHVAAEYRLGPVGDWSVLATGYEDCNIDLRAGRARVHGQGQVHQIRANSKGFAITLHVRGSA